MALKIKENEFAVLCVHPPDCTEKELLIIKVTLDGNKFFDIPEEKCPVSFHPEVIVRIVFFNFINDFKIIFSALFSGIFRIQRI